jgi:N-formylglutamate amidohydrolase
VTNVLPIAIVIPHSGLEIPPEVAERIALDEGQIFDEADAYADLLFDFGERVLHWVTFPFARAIVDVNRQPDPASNRLGDGIIKRQTSYGAPVYRPGMEPEPAMEEAMITRYWADWHRQLQAIEADQRVKLVIDAHTMAAFGPSHYDDPAALRPRVSVSNLGEADGQAHPERQRLSCSPQVVLALGRELGASLADVPALCPVGPNMAVNSPFFGGWDLWQHGGAHQPWLMVEVNRALYVGEQTGMAGATPVDIERIALLRENIWEAIVRLMSELSL